MNNVLKDAKRIQDVKRIQAALEDTFDTGNALADEIEIFAQENDLFEVEQALMGQPETVDGIVRDTDYFLMRLRDGYIDAVLNQLDEIEEEHAHGAQSR